MHAVLGAEAGYAFDDRCARDPAVKQKVEDARVNRNSMMLGSIAEIEGDLDGFSTGEHFVPFVPTTED